MSDITCRECDISLSIAGELVDEYFLCHACYCSVMDTTRRTEISDEQD